VSVYSIFSWQTFYQSWDLEDIAGRSVRVETAKRKDSFKLCAKEGEIGTGKRKRRKGKKGKKWSEDRIETACRSRKKVQKRVENMSTYMVRLKDFKQLIFFRFKTGYMYTKKASLRHEIPFPV